MNNVISDDEARERLKKINGGVLTDAEFKNVLIDVAVKMAELKVSNITFTIGPTQLGSLNIEITLSISNETRDTATVQ